MLEKKCEEIECINCPFKSKTSFKYCMSIRLNEPLKIILNNKNFSLKDQQKISKILEIK